MNVINFHFIDHCNYKCRYCFADKNNIMMSFENIKKCVDNISLYFEKSRITNGVINLVGGEIFLHPDLQRIIDYIYSKNIRVSIVTNASMLTKEFIQLNKNKIFKIGISIDSLSAEKNKILGRCCNNQTLSKSKLIELCTEIKKNNIELKINHCLSKYNVDEDISDFIKTVKPNRFKIFQMTIIESINSTEANMVLSDEEFTTACQKYLEFSPIIEYAKDIVYSYLMVNSKGDFSCNKNFQAIGNILENDFSDLIKEIPKETIDSFNRNKRNNKLDYEKELISFIRNTTTKQDIFKVDKGDFNIKKMLICFFIACLFLIIPIVESINDSKKSRNYDLYEKKCYFLFNDLPSVLICNVSDKELFVEKAGYYIPSYSEEVEYKNNDLKKEILYEKTNNHQITNEYLFVEKEIIPKIKYGETLLIEPHRICYLANIHGLRIVKKVEKLEPAFGPLCVSNGTGEFSDAFLVPLYEVNEIVPDIPNTITTIIFSGYKENNSQDIEIRNLSRESKFCPSHEWEYDEYIACSFCSEETYEPVIENGELKSYLYYMQEYFFYQG